jgi:hypothetical protein
LKAGCWSCSALPILIRLMTLLFLRLISIR